MVDRNDIRKYANYLQVDEDDPSDLLDVLWNNLSNATIQAIETDPNLLEKVDKIYEKKIRDIAKELPPDHPLRIAIEAVP